MTDPCTRSAAPLAGRHAVVTGGGRGIGAAIATRLAGLGATLTLMGRTAGALEVHARTLGRSYTIPVDVCDDAAVTAAFARAAELAGPVDILINNAGAAAAASFARTDAAHWTYMLEVNLTSVYRCSRAVLASMLERNWGRIVSVASTAGLRGYAYVTAYCAAKHGVIGLTRSLALECARSEVTVNAVCPGYTETGLLDAALENIMEKTRCSRDDAASQLKRSNPQNRFIQPAEVAATVAWLCSPGAESITGQAIAVAGGELM
ncbi:MAG: SDR family oxidoreductase [Gammaproteobacteria bacterium]|nr:SDR family oxidoreductase [Gammaproteobacteria bacterium]